MHTNAPKEDPLVEMGYEIRDINVPNIRKAVLWFFGFAIGSALIGWTVYNNRFVVFNLPQKDAPANAILTRPIPGEPNPLLQNNVTAKTDIMTLRRRERERIGSTGYNEDKSTVHIPVDQAMDILVARGLPRTAVPPTIVPVHVLATPVKAVAGKNLSGKAPIGQSEGAVPVPGKVVPATSPKISGNSTP
jgi:hypothetical protein